MSKYLPICILYEGVAINYIKTVELHDGHSNFFDFQNRLVFEFKLDDFAVSLCYDNTNQFAINIDPNRPIRNTFS